MIKVRATKIGYYKHARIKVGQVFVIDNMQQFTKKWMNKVDADAKDEIEPPVGLRSAAAISSGASKALHEGKVDKPTESVKEDKGPEENQATTSGNEEVI